MQAVIVNIVDAVSKLNYRMLQGVESGIKIKISDMEHKIGEIVTMPDGRKAEVVERGYSCELCIFNIKRLCYIRTVFEKCNCAALIRTNHKNVIYKEIKEVDNDNRRIA